MNDILINVSDERGAAIGEAFLSGYRYIKRIFRGTSSSGSGKVKVFMIMGINPEICKWTKAEDPGGDECYEASCEGAFCFLEGDHKENDYNFCPKCGHQIEVEEI